MFDQTKKITILFLLMFCFSFFTVAQESASKYDTSEEGQNYWFFGNHHIPGPEEKRFISDVGKLLVPHLLRRMTTLNDVKDNISELALDVPYEWRKNCYEKNKIDLGGDLDFLGSFGDFSVFMLGFGLPNFMQSDFLWGGIWFGTEILGYTLMGVGLSAVADFEFSYSIFAGFLALWGMPFLVIGGFALDALFPFSILWLKKWGSFGVHAARFVASFLFSSEIASFGVPSALLVWGARLGTLVTAIIRSVRYNSTLKEALLIQNKKQLSFVPVLDLIGKNYGLAMSLKL